MESPPVTYQAHMANLGPVATTRIALLRDQMVTASHRRAVSLASGNRLAGRYRIERLLGKGGMGEVYAVMDEELGMQVALKTLRLDAYYGPTALWRLKREVVLARAVVHPSVCRVYDLGRHGRGADSAWFLTMELLPGQTLAERLKQKGRLETTAALPWVQHMAAGLGAAHRAGVVHRDFKSGNVLLVKRAGEERAVVVDFGLARAMSGLAPAGSTPTPESSAEPAVSDWAGTPSYMAPEQVNGQEAGAAADVYALGVVMYEMVTGELPFKGGTAIEVARRRLVDDPPSPRRVVRELDDRWEAVILRCLAREPEQRFLRVEEVGEALAEQWSAADIRTPATATRATHRLPAECDAFLGRAAEVEELGKRIAGGARLVTLLGAAGMGKTRLAVHYGWQTRAEWERGSWFCDLSEARTVSGIVSAVAGSLEVRLTKGDPVAALGHAIAGRGRCLIILDNFEQVVELAAETVGRWVEQAHAAHFVVTSRERLNLSGEEIQEVEPLSLESGVELCVDRARRLRPGFEPRGQDLESIRKVVHWVEGIPLGIELAAARLRVMTPAQLCERMQDRLRMLGGLGSGRHATLRAAIDGSWELLQPWEKAALGQCSVFEGGFTLQAAEEVLDLTSWPEAPWVVDVVQSLVDQSLLRTWVPAAPEGAWSPEARCGMYMSIQEYAREKLADSGAVPGGGSGARAVTAAEERHGAWYSGLGTVEAVRALDREDGWEKRRSLELEIENLAAACQRAVARGDGSLAVALLRALWIGLDVRGPIRAVREQARAILALSLRPEAQAQALRIHALASWRSGRHAEARGSAEEALAIYRQLNDRRGEATILGLLGNLDSDEDKMDGARAHLEAALALHRQIGDRHHEGKVLDNLGIVDQRDGKLEASRTHYEAAIAVFRTTRERSLEASTLGNLGSLHYSMGDMVRARANYEAALAALRLARNRRGEGIVLGNLGILHHSTGQLEEARSTLEAAIAISREVGDRRDEGHMLGSLGTVLMDEGRMEEARACFEDAITICRETGNRSYESYFRGSLGNLHLKEERFDEAHAELGAALAISRELKNQVLEGHLIGCLGNLHLRQGRLDEARQLLAKAETILRQCEAPLELGHVLCNRVEVELQLGDVAAAKHFLDEGDAHVARLGDGADSQFRNALARLHRTVDDRAS